MYLEKKSDPLAYLLIKQLQLTPSSFAIISIVVTLGSQLPLAWACNALVSRPGQIGILQDLNFWTWCLLLQPITFGYYLWSTNALNNVIDSLKRLETIEISDENIEPIKIGYQKRYRLFLSLAIATFLTLTLFISNQTLTNSWFYSLRFAKILAIINYFVNTYIISMLVSILIINIWALHQVIKKNKLNINPLHPDRCGGLSPLSQYSLKTAYLAATFGAVISLVEYTVITQEIWANYWFLHLGIPLYFILSVGCFFGPLLTANIGMQDAKDELLGDIAKQFKEDYQQTHNSLNSDAEALKLQFAKINQLRSWYRLTSEFPVWPFDTKTLRRYVLSLTTSLVPLFAGICQQIVKQLFDAQ